MPRLKQTGTSLYLATDSPSTLLRTYYKVAKHSNPTLLLTQPQHAHLTLLYEVSSSLELAVERQLMLQRLFKHLQVYPPNTPATSKAYFLATPLPIEWIRTQAQLDITIQNLLNWFAIYNNNTSLAPSPVAPALPPYRLPRKEL